MKPITMLLSNNDSLSIEVGQFLKFYDINVRICKTIEGIMSFTNYNYSPFIFVELTSQSEVDTFFMFCNYITKHAFVFLIVDKKLDIKYSRNVGIIDREFVTLELQKIIYLLKSYIITDKVVSKHDNKTSPIPPLNVKKTCKGVAYLRSMASLYTYMPEKFSSIRQNIYPIIAASYNIKEANVERCVRVASLKALKNNKIPKSLCLNKRCPDIACVVKYLAEKYYFML